MNRVLFVFFLLCPKLIFSQIGNNEVLLTNGISYRIDVSDFKDYKVFGGKLFDLLTDTNKIMNYQCYEWNPFEYTFTDFTNYKMKPLTNWQIARRVYYGKDYPSFDVDGRILNDSIDRFNFRNDTTQLFRFSEAWIYDTVNLKFYKRIDFIRPTVKIYKDSELKGTRAPYSVMLKQTSIIDTLLYLPNVQYDVEIVNEIGAYGDWNPDNNIEPTERLTFLKFILYEIYTGKIKAYKDSSGIKLITQVADILNIKWTDELIKNEKEFSNKQFPGEEFDPEPGASVNYFNGRIEEINKIRFIEEWIFDDTHQCFIKKVKGMGFIAFDEAYEEEAIKALGKEYEKYFKDDPKKQPLFWIFFE
jgi:hypothetical protein